MVDRPLPGFSPVTRAAILFTQRIDRRRIVAVGLTLLCGVLVAQTLASARATAHGLGQTAPVVVAENDLEPGHVISDADVRTEHHPVGLLPPRTVGEPALVVGSVVRSTVLAGEPIGLHRVESGRLGLAGHERAVTVPKPLAPPPVEVGDGVELVGVDLVPGTEVVDARLLGPGRVLHQDDDGITVAVSAPLSIVLVEWLAAGAVDLIVTPAGTG